jgi:hypothetical protein
MLLSIFNFHIYGHNFVLLHIQSEIVFEGCKIEFNESLTIDFCKIQALTICIVAIFNTIFILLLFLYLEEEAPLDKIEYAKPLECISTDIAKSKHKHEVCF